MTINRSNLTQNELKILQALFHILQNVWRQKSSSFSGLGVILYTSLDELSVFPLRDSCENFALPIYGWHDIELTLKEISEKSSIYHDGFHLISTNVSLTHIAQYFSPPIVKNLVTKHRNELFGCRYLAAQFGSCLKGVMATALVSNSYGCVLFVNGVEVDLGEES
jgi:hypothetical protein